MKAQICDIVLVGLESKTFENKTRWNGYFNVLIDKNFGYRCFSLNIDDDLLPVLQKVGLGHSFKAVLSESKRVARSSGSFADYVTEFAITPIS